MKLWLVTCTGPWYVPASGSWRGTSDRSTLPIRLVDLARLSPLQDAYVLASVLAATTRSSLDAALEAYQQTRLPVANHVLTTSRETGKMYEFNSAFAEEYSTLGPAIGRQWGFLTESTPEGEAEKAVGILRMLQKQ